MTKVDGIIGQMYGKLLVLYRFTFHFVTFYEPAAAGYTSSSSYR